MRHEDARGDELVDHGGHDHAQLAQPLPVEALEAADVPRLLRVGFGLGRGLGLGAGGWGLWSRVEAEGRTVCPSTEVCSKLTWIQLG